MSIELLPPTPEYPNKWHVRANSCKCHQETCCCNDWAVYNADGKKCLSFFAEEDALLEAAMRNAIGVPANARVQRAERSEGPLQHDVMHSPKRSQE